ncbi:unnamed protein product [Lampetra fluviatilis]
MGKKKQPSDAGIVREDGGVAPAAKMCCGTGYPISIGFVVVNEFCERFSYYGMRAVLVIYFNYFLLWSENTSTAAYHAFISLCYFTPIIGAIIADSWLGKFKTIIYLSIVYAAGQIVTSVSAIPTLSGPINASADSGEGDAADKMAVNDPTVHVALTILGLVLIALGTGGIKPCVAAFGGDQFEEEQEKERSRFFSIFYLSINAGSLISTFVTPILRGTQCFNQDCFALAFGVPAVLMVVALVVFIGGSGMYKKVPPKGNILLEVSRCIGFAISNRFRHRGKQFPKRDHWLDWARESYNGRLIAQIKMVFKVLFLYLPLPMFWALYDQQGSRWTFQATRMDGDFGSLVIQPDQMQVLYSVVYCNVVYGVVYSVVYSVVYCNVMPLRRITVGMLFLGVAFVVAGVIQIMVDVSSTLARSPQGPPPAPVIPHKGILVHGQRNLTLRESGVPLEWSEVADECLACSVVVLEHRAGSERSLVEPGTAEEDPCAPPPGLHFPPTPRFINALDVELTVTMGDVDYGAVQGLSNSSYHEILKGEKTNIQVKDGNSSVLGVFVENIGFGGSYTILLYKNAAGELLRRSEVDIQPNSVHMGWQVPQYLLLTIGEVIFSVTGLEFSYSQAPPNMKSVLQAAWLLTVAFGNIIVLIVAEAGQMTQQYAEFFLFAGLLFALSVLFAVMAYFYTYVDPAEVEREFDRLDQEEERRRASGGGGEEKSKDEHRGGMELAGVYDEPLKQTKM